MTHYCVIRTDLPIGHIIAQTIHAAGESSTGDLPPGTRAVALAAKNESELEEIEKRLILRKIPHIAIREPDMGNALTAVGICPLWDRGSLKGITTHLKLIKHVNQCNAPPRDN